MDDTLFLAFLITIAIFAFTILGGEIKSISLEKRLDSRRRN
jgi:hypothetical protein